MEEFEEMKGYVEHVTITSDNVGAEGEFDSSTNINIAPISTCSNTEYLSTYANTSQGESNLGTESPQKMDIITQACQMASLSPFKQPSTSTRSPSLLFSPQTSALYQQMLEVSEQFSSANTPESSHQRLVDFTSLNDVHPIQTEFQPRTSIMPIIRNVFPGQFEQRYTDPRLLRLPAVRGFFYPSLPPTKIHQVTNNDLIRTIHENTDMPHYVGTSLSENEHINVPPNVTVSVNSQIPMGEASSDIFQSCLLEHSSFYTDHASISTNEIVNPTETQKLVLPSKAGPESSQHHRSFLHRLMAGSETAKIGTHENLEEPTKNRPPLLDKLIETSKKKKGKRNKFPLKRSIASQQNKVTKNIQNKKECMSDEPTLDVNVIWSRPISAMQEQPSDCEALELSSVSRSSNSEEETFLGRLRKKTKTSVVLKPIQCKLCNKRVSRSSYLKIHMKLHNKTEQNQASNTSDKISYKQLIIDHVSQHNDQKLYKCNVCSKTYRNHGAFIFHKRIHTPKGEIRANHPTSKENERTTKRTKRDIKILPKTHKRVTCSFCKKKFSRSNYLKIHKRIHTGETPFTCQFCEKQFKYKRTYVEHVAAHKDIKLYECEICGKNYGRQSAFDVHRRNHKKKGETTNSTSAGKTTAPNVTSNIDISPLSSMESTDRFKKKPPLKRLNDVLTEEDTITKAIKSKQLFEKIGSKLKCLVCGKIFIKQHLLNIHLKGHELNINRNESYTCSHCAEDVSSIGHLKDHVIKHALEIFEKSINSRKEFPTNEMKNSSIRHDNKKGLGDSSDEGLTIRFEDNEKNKPLRKRRRKIEEMIAQNLISPSKPKDRARKRKATTPTKLINHNNVEAKYEAQNDGPEDEVPLYVADADAADDDCEEEDGNKFPESEKTIHMVTEQQRNRNKSETCESLICLVCGQQMANSTSLRVHMRIHPRSKLICDKCGREYKYEHYLRKHMESHDSKEDSTRKRDLKVTCEECNKCIRYDCLKSHMRTHTGERPFQCDQCGATFKQITHLKMHLKIHSGDKPYQCLECGKVFRKTGNLVVHMRNHTGERPYVCDQCGLTFKHLALYKEHLASHKGIILYQCDICGHKYKSRSGYDSHRRRHHLQDLTYKCFCCGVIYQSAQEVKNCECFALKNRSTEENLEHPIGFSKIAEPLSESNAVPQPQTSSNINQLDLSNPISSVYSSMMDMLNDHIPGESANEMMLIGHPYQQQQQ